MNSAELTVRIPPRSRADWDAAVLEALSVLKPPDNAARPTPETGQERPVSNILGILSWHPALTKAFLVFNSHLFASTLSHRVRELVTVRVSWLRRGEYEWAQHVKMGLTAGLSPEEIDAISGGAEFDGWDPVDIALLRAVDEIVQHRYVSDATWALLGEHFSRQELMDLVFTIGTYDLLAMAFNIFGLQLDSGMEGFPARATA